ncbi:MAG: LolA family protein, partial [Thermodesulfobacteriota bacterium]
MFTSLSRHILYPLVLSTLCAGLLAISAPGHTATEADQATLQELLQAPFQPEAPTEQRISDFSATFAQEAHIASLNRTKQGHGKVTVRFNADKAASFRWDYLEPEVQHIISNGIKLWVYLPESNRVMISDVAEHLKSGDDPLLFLRSLDNLERHFELSIPEPARSETGAYLLTLTPKEESAYVNTLTLHIPEEVVEGETSKRFPLGGVTILDPNGNTTALKFREVEVNTRPEAKT